MSMDVTAEIDLHDSEIAKVGEVMVRLRERAGHRDLESFRVEIIDRFVQIGLEVDPLVWSTNVAGVYIFEVVIKARLEGEFDPERQVHEVTNDILGLGEGGVINTKKKQTPGLWTPGSKK